MKEMPFLSLNTPAVLLNLDRLEANIREIQQAANEAGVKLRPHTKIHQCVEIAKLQVAAGACGIEVGTIEQAESMAEGGLDDILVAHPFYGDHKFEILKRLLRKSKVKTTVVVDMIEQAKGISQVGQSVGRMIPVLIKIDTGVDRYGVLPGEPTLNLAKKIQMRSGIELVGIYAHESGANVAKGIDEGAFEVASIMAETTRMLRAEGIILETVAVGASPTFYATCRYIKEGKFPEITEIHPGARVIGDIVHGNTRESCVLTVLTTIVSTSHLSHVVIDAGFKTFGCDSMIQYRDTPSFFWKGKPSWGSIQGRPDLWFGRLNAETSCIYYTQPEKKLHIGDRLEIVPNNATMVISIHDKMYGVRNGVVEKAIPVTGRGKAYG